MTDEQHLDIEIQAVEVLSYALAHNRLPVIGQIRLTGLTRSVRGAVVEVSISDAQGMLSAPFSVLADLEAGVEAVLRDVPVTLDPAQMSLVEEQRPGIIQVEVRQPDGVVAGEAVLGRAQAAVQVLAANQWLRTPAPVTTEILASFVMPNHPAVEALLHDAATVLVRDTGSGTLQGYQAAEDRVDEIVRAVFVAAQGRRIGYVEPPASWSDRGQKVRTPGEVFEGLVGTCLDIMLALAAVLEQAGIRPLLFLVEGHAFLGYWRVEASLQNTLETDPAAVINLIDLGAIGLIETTMITSDGVPAAFEDAHRPPYVAYLTGEADQVQGIVDVYQARQNGIIPLPAHVRTGRDSVQIFDYRPATSRTVGPVSQPTAPRPSSNDRVRVPPRVQNWKNALLDLSLRNRLINFTERASVALSVPQGQLAGLEDLVNEPRLLHLLPRDQLDAIHAERGVGSGWDLPADHRAALLADRGQIFCDLPTESYQGRMRNLAYKARTLVEETGANNLYLALGSLVWTMDDRALRSPLVLIPVQLKAASRGSLYRVNLDESGASVPNFCLLEKLRQVHGLDIPDLHTPPEPAGEIGIDLDAALRAVRVALNLAGLPYRVEETAHLGVLQFAKFRLWKDLDENWSAFAGNPLVRHLIHSPTEAFADNHGSLDTVPAVERDLDELAANCPVAADASQLAAVADAVAGQTFVLEGPPGTGKSQTITNLLTRAMVDGKRVLFVAEKRAALDVVRKRLDLVGMGSFSLDLHDKGSKPAVVRAQVLQALDATVELDTQGIAAEQERLRAARGTLARYARGLHAQNRAGLSYYSAHTAQLSLSTVPRPLAVSARLVAESGGADALPAVRRALQDLPDTAELVNPRRHHPWGFVGITDPLRVDERAICAAVLAVGAALARLHADHALHEVLMGVRTPAELAIVASIATSPRAQLWILDDVRNTFWEPAAENAIQRTLDFSRAWHPGMEVALPDVLGLPLADLHTQAVSAATAGFFGRKKRLRAVLAQLEAGLRPDVRISPRDVPGVLGQLLAVQTAARTLATQINQIPGVALSQVWNPLMPAALSELEGQVGWLRWASAFVAPNPSGQPAGRALREFLSLERSLTDEEATVLASLVAGFESVEQATGSSEQEMARWTAGQGLIDSWRGSAAGRDVEDPQLLDLRRWVSFVVALQPLNRPDLQAARADLMNGEVRADEAVQAFDLGVAGVSLTERSQATGLASFDERMHERTIARFNSTAVELRTEMATALPAALVRRRSFDSTNQSGRIGGLRRELSKQRRGLGVRSLLSRYGDLITQVMPCVLVSPDSLSRFFAPTPGLFDLVVFDEASQIRVAEAVGAMGRASSVVVVGDSKQMPPTSFGELSGDVVDDPDLSEALGGVEDEESILSECVQAGVPRRWLSWHYRSQHESLIAFSNAVYYEDRLSTFPTPKLAAVGPQTDGVGVSLVRVNGEFQRTRGPLHRTNTVEAEHIVDAVQQRFAVTEGAVPSIGIVTFNVQQRTLIESLLRDRGDERIVEALDSTEEGLFVKNLENVQGDERDTIFFSTAFSANRYGKLPLNFGPLNREGGQRRLNVAVTRARRQVIVFCSFDPDQLRAEETSSRGVKDLRAYLDLAAAGPGVLDTLVTRHRRSVIVDRHREAVAQALRDHGLVAVTNVGLSEFKIDITVALPDAPDQPRLAVLLDGPDWASRGTVGDRDGLPIEVLSGLMRWPAVERVWLPAWLTNPEPTIERLLAAAEERPEPSGRVGLSGLVGPADEPGQPVQPHHPADELSSTRAAATRSEPPEPTSADNEDRPFSPWLPRPIGSRTVLDNLPRPSAVAAVRAAIEEIVTAEGPIQAGRLARLIAESFDLHRLSDSRSRSILAAVPDELWDSEGEFVWPRDLDRDGWKIYRRQHATSERPLEHICLREIVNAMAGLARRAAGMTVDDLFSETNAVFGGTRMTPAVRARLQAAAEDGVRTRTLLLSGDGLVSTPAFG